MSSRAKTIRGWSKWMCVAAILVATTAACTSEVSDGQHGDESTTGRTGEESSGLISEASGGGCTLAFRCTYENRWGICVGGWDYCWGTGRFCTLACNSEM